jgi:hypothetical protein
MVLGRRFNPTGFKKHSFFRFPINVSTLRVFGNLSLKYIK